MKIAYNNYLYEARNYSTLKEIVNKYSSYPDMYISFRVTDKIGINPNNKYDTPIGVYCYNVALSSRENFPFPYLGGRKKGEPTYVYVVKPKSGAVKLDLERYAGEDYVRDLEKLVKARYIDSSEAEYRKKFITESEELSNNDIDYSELEKALHDMAGLPLTKKPSGRIGRLLWNTVKGVSTSTTNWNTILRRLGYHYVVDSGRGIIHENEPQQTIFLDPVSYDVVNSTIMD